MAAEAPTLKCDLVMKGGITSGIVYPNAVCELAEEFRFMSIGGTSAGAIAAALTAAAEFRRQSNAGDSAGFKILAAQPQWLAEAPSGRSHLFELFQPAEETKGLFEVAIPWLESKPLLSKLASFVRRLLETFTRFTPLVVAGGLVAGLILAFAAVLLWASPQPARRFSLAPMNPSLMHHK